MFSPSSRSLLLLRRAGPLRAIAFRPLHRSSAIPLSRAATQQCQRHDTAPRRREFHVSAAVRKGLFPDSEDPTPPNPEPDLAGGSSKEEMKPAELSTDEYHEIADEYIDDLVGELEEMADEGHGKIEVEFSSNVLTLTTPHGTYVLNKQPPKKQIWLSSPITGPAHYDFVLQGGDHQHQKEGTDIDDDTDLRGGAWISLRDGSSLTALLKKEVGIEMEEEEVIAKGPVI